MHTPRMRGILFDLSNQYIVFGDRMRFQVVPVVKVHVANVASVPWHLAALVSGVSPQRVPVLVPFTAIFAHPRFVCKRKTHIIITMYTVRFIRNIMIRYYMRVYVTENR